jgi:type III restriction enzyme
MAIQMLHEKLTNGAEFLGNGDIEHYKKNIPDCIANNLNPNFEIRPYQLEAFGRFKYYKESYPNRPKDSPTQVLYHMATGSGKTLVMAGLILYLYSQGHRNFLFFVNSSNIINKTRDNFLNTRASKYLFNETVNINNKTIRIKEVDNFQAANPEDINIFFSTIQGLHSRLNTPRENSITYNDFESEKIVLISDEAHHINAETKLNKINQAELFELTSWESTVNKIFNSNPQNILLEFTATADLTNDQIVKKYQDKIIFDYPLKAFRIDGYSKEVKVLQSDTQEFDRALQAILLSQFRRKIFEKHGCLIKPVILFKSKTIKESHAFFELFLDKIKNLTAEDLEKLKNNPNLDNVLKEVFAYLSLNQISLTNLALELKEDFNEAKCISVNSKDESEQKQIAVNTLEDTDNEYRAVFAVDKLNEGWDVLNLFDIVRLYNTRDAKAGKAGKTTLSEAQLIGRGARYCPFKVNEEQPLYQRKYDSRNTEKDHELKLCEELYYHSAYNPSYISELHRALVEIGIKARESRELKLTLKPEFKEKHFYKTGFVFKNERINYAREDVIVLNAYFIQTTHKIKLLTGYSQSSTAFELEISKQANKKQKDFFINSFGASVVKKALSQFPQYQFSSLKHLFPHLSSISEFINSADYLGKIKVEIENSEDRLNQLSQSDKLLVIVQVLEKLSEQLQLENIAYKGTKEFKPFMIKDTFSDKTMNIVNDGNSDKELGLAQSQSNNSSLVMDLSTKDWFVFNENYGTSEEKYLVKYIDKVIDKLKEKYTEVYLLRNERHFKLFNFDDGRPFEPDFVLFLIKECESPSLHYQVFIEPKGSQLIEHDKWKHNFLMQLKTEHKIEQLWKDKNYVVWGMPFFNEKETKPAFEKEFGGLIE